ncbi:MAG: pentapeptide repeat-containing protein [Hormoscilla sp.]
MTTAKNFSGQNLQGRSFKGQDLAGADFSHADIRGANFTKANLEGANFSHAKAGLQRKWVIGLCILAFVLSSIAGAAAVGDSSYLLKYLIPNDKYNRESSIIPTAVNLIINIGFWGFILRNEVGKALGWSAASVAGFLTLVGFVSSWGSEYIPWVQPLRSRYFIAAISSEKNQSPVAALIVEMLVCSIAAIAAVVAMSLAMVLAELIAGKKTKRLALIWALGVAIIGTGNRTRIMLRGARPRAERGVFAYSAEEFVFNIVFIAVAIALAVAVVYLTNYVAKRVLAEDEQYIILRKLGIAIAAIGGTSFRGANLMDACFSSAILPTTDFRKADSIRTYWIKAQKLEWARVGEKTLLINPAVRDLFVTGDGEKKDFAGANMRGGNLIGANLSDANLKEADLSESLLQYACLEGANLSQVQAIGSDFAHARLTDAYGLGTWNIDSTTNLEEVDCKWVYLLEYPKVKTRDRERRPSSGEFGEGEFTKLFQEVLSTVDLIFRNGIDWKAFTYSFKQVQVENEDTELTIQSIENKGDGVVVVRVEVPPEANKAKIHSEFNETYERALEALEAQYQETLRGKQELLDRNVNMMEIVKHLARREIEIYEKPTPAGPAASGKLVILKLGPGDFDRGFPVTLQIGAEGSPPSTEKQGNLPPAPELANCYSQWQDKYRKLNMQPRIKAKKTQKTNISPIGECQELAKALHSSLNDWLNSAEFRPVKDTLLQKLDPREEIRVIIQASDMGQRRLPWQLWDLFTEYRQAEIALSTPEYDISETPAREILRSKVRILAILGSSEGINIQKDRELLEQLPNADTRFLVGPTRREIDLHLWDDAGWDMLFFAGHSSTKEDKGCLEINEQDSIEINDLYNALRKAVDLGLKLAIFNSCDGLGLARELADLQIPQIIVMREPVYDAIAEAFMQDFVKAYASGKTLYNAVREAREKLQGWEEDYPCASWLPVICQHPTAVPQTWAQLRGLPTVAPPREELLELLASLKEAIFAATELAPVDQYHAVEQVEVLVKGAIGHLSETQQAQNRKAMTYLRGAIGPLTSARGKECAALLQAIGQQFPIE